MKCEEFENPKCATSSSCPNSIQVGTYSLTDELVNVIIDSQGLRVGADVETDASGLLIISFPNDFDIGTINEFMKEFVIEVYHEGVLLTGTDEDGDEADQITVFIDNGLTDTDVILKYE